MNTKYKLLLSEIILDILSKSWLNAVKVCSSSSPAVAVFVLFFRAIEYSFSNSILPF